ncbi:MAG: GUN4 domain-containing protein [Cyanobacteria bacterium SBLK]|nr:GUN4 domain-containing protein [Cyanobacteria bacterium SBLK]
MPKISPQPRKDDPVLGEIASTPANASILGGIEGVKKRLAGSDERERLAALEDALNYDEEGLQIVIAALQSDCIAIEIKAWELLRDREEPQVTKALFLYDPIGPSREAEYRTLRQLLEKGNWQEADKETKSILLRLAKRQDKWLRKEDILKIPALELVACDRLWLRYSRGRFGFSVQAQLLENQGLDLSNSSHLDERSSGFQPYSQKRLFESFAKTVGWYVKNDEPKVITANDIVYRKKHIPFNLSSPRGHLPLTFELGGGTWTYQPINDDDYYMGWGPDSYRSWDWGSCVGPEIVKAFLAYFHQCSQRHKSAKK